MKNEKIIILLIKAFLFLIIIGSIIEKCSFVFNEQNSGDLTWKAFYEQKDDSIDFLFFGNSHLGNGLDLNVINSKTKSKVYTLYSSGQTLPQAYYNIKEALNYQNPKLIILETFLISSDTIRYFNKPISVKKVPLKVKLQSFDSKKLGLVKLEEYRDLFKGEDILTTFFPVLRNHSNWSNLNLIRSNFSNKINPKSEYYFGSSNSIWPLNQSKIDDYKAKNFGNSKFNISNYQLFYFNKIMSLAKSKNIEVLLITIPYFKEYRKKIDYISVHNSITNLALKNKIKYLDFNSLFPEMDYHYFTNEVVGHNQHLNYKGGIVVSNSLSNFINYNYNYKLDNGNKSLPEYYLYNKIKRDSLIGKGNIIGNLDAINGTKNLKFKITQGNSSIVLDGWMAIKDKKSENHEMFVAMVKDENFIYVSSPLQLKPKTRKDVTKHFKKEDNFYDDSGFIININSKLLELGNYKLFFVLRNNAGEVFIKNTYKHIEVK